MPVKFVFKNQVKEKKKRISDKFSFFLTSQKNRITRGARSNIKLSNSTPSPIRDHTIVRSFVCTEPWTSIQSTIYSFQKSESGAFRPEKKKKSSANIEIAFHDLPRDTRYIGGGEKRWNEKKKRGKKKGGKEWTHENAYVAQKKKKKKNVSAQLHNTLETVCSWDETWCKLHWTDSWVHKVVKMCYES